MADSLEEILDALAQTPQKVLRIVRELSEQHLKGKNSAEEFSALENICHLRDIEVEGYTERIGRIVHQTRPSLPDIDGGRLAIERDYNRQDAREALEQFTLARERNLQLLRALTPDQLAREGLLEGVGIVSLEKLLEMMREHDKDHIDELQIILRRIDRDSQEHG